MVCRIGIVRPVHDGAILMLPESTPPQFQIDDMSSPRDNKTRLQINGILATNERCTIAISTLEYNVVAMSYAEDSQGWTPRKSALSSSASSTRPLSACNIIVFCHSVQTSSQSRLSLQACRCTSLLKRKFWHVQSLFLSSCLCEWYFHR
jgi:hypothetical protein